MSAGWCTPVLICALVLSASGAVRMQVVEGRPVMDGVFVNGHGPYRFLVDTATTMNHMEPGLARSIGLEATFRTRLSSSVGDVEALGSEGIEIVVGEARAGGQQFLFAGMEVVHELAGGIQGILGQSFLSRFDYFLDLKRKRFEFGKQTVTGNRSPFRVHEGRNVISTSLGELVLDSGTATLVLFGVNPDGANESLIKTLAGSRAVGMVYSKLIVEGRQIWRGNAVAIPDRFEPGVAGLMPLSLFRTIYVCNSEGFVVFE